MIDEAIFKKRVGNPRHRLPVSFNSHKIWFHSIRRIMTSLLSLKTDRPEFDTRSELGATTLCSFLASDPNKRIPNWLLDRPFKRPPPRHRRISGEKKIARLSKQPDLLCFYFVQSPSPMYHPFFCKLFPIDNSNRTMKSYFPSYRFDRVEIWRIRNEST